MKVQKKNFSFFLGGWVGVGVVNMLSASLDGGISNVVC